MITQMPSVLIKLKKMKVKTKGSHIWIKIPKSVTPPNPIHFTHTNNTHTLWIKIP